MHHLADFIGTNWHFTGLVLFAVFFSIVRLAMSNGIPQQQPIRPINPHEMKKEDFRRGVITFALVIVGIGFAVSLLVLLFFPNVEAITRRPISKYYSL